MSESANVALGIEKTPTIPVSNGKLGMWLFLCSDAMGFTALLAIYTALRATAVQWPVPSENLGIPLTAFNTFVLICSSLSMVKALSAIKKGNIQGLRFFLALTILGGVTFLSLQAFEWTRLITGGGTAPKELFWATFFVLTGFHGAHVTGGVVALTLMFLRTFWKKGYTQNEAPDVEVLGLYWHFVDLVWILIFTFVYLI